MPWKECDKMSLKEEFTMLANQPETNMAQLCRRFGISRKTGYKWLRRFRQTGIAGLQEASRRPNVSPQRTTTDVEQAVLKIRDAHPAWGGRKIRRRLSNMGFPSAPAASTITEILRRHNRIDSEASRQTKPLMRFEHPHPNDLWQMDFKGHFATLGEGRCHPLTVLDDHSRYSLGLRACGNERGVTVQMEVTSIFRRYGMPRAMLMDNGSPWGSDLVHRDTQLTVWLMERGVRVTHGRPYHPQTQGKEERFHRTLKAEVLQGREFRNLASCQKRFDEWRDIYNTIRPHEALELDVPASRFRVSHRSFLEQPLVWDYDQGAEVRKVDCIGKISFRGRSYRVGRAFAGRRVGLKPWDRDGVWDVYFLRTKIQRIDLREERF